MLFFFGVVLSSVGFYYLCDKFVVLKIKPTTSIHINRILCETTRYTVLFFFFISPCMCVWTYTSLDLSLYVVLQSFWTVAFTRIHKSLTQS